MLLATDLDDVLADTIPLLAEFHNERYGTTLRFEDYTTYHQERLWKCSIEEAQRRHDEFRASDYFKKIMPISGAVEGARQLAATHELIVVTARPFDIEDKTREFLDTYFGTIFAQVVLTNLYAGRGRSKAEVCQEQGVKLLIEDALEHAIPCRKANIPVILYDKPWNRDDASFERAHTWKEIVQKVNAGSI